jgi:hypothetical protein
LWTSIDRALFSENSAIFKDEFKLAYCFHLWNGATGSWLDEIDGNYVATSKSIYAEIAREVEGGTKSVPLNESVEGGIES